MLPKLVTRTPTPAMMCNYLLGGKDNFAADRSACQAILEEFPDWLDAARASRLFMYRAVRYLARYARIGQFLDLGCGLPLAPNVHEVARRFDRTARTVYVDSAPVVVAHARALLATDGHTGAVAADISTPEQVLTDPVTQLTLDVSQPVGVLVLSTGHLIGDDAALRMLTTITDRIASGSYVVATHWAGVNQRVARRASQTADRLGLDWRFRTPSQVRRLLGGLRPIRPGLVDVTAWRPDPKQPPLPRVDAPLAAYLCEPNRRRQLIAFGGVLRRTGPAQLPTRPRR